MIAHRNSLPFVLQLMDKQINFKILVLGAQGVGKSSLIMRYLKGQFSESYNVTVGVEFASKVVEVQEGLQVRLQIWDTAGQEFFKALVRTFYKGISAVFLVYAIDKADSLQELRRWVDEVRENSHEEVVMFLIGSRLDRAHLRQVDPSKAAQFLNEIQGALLVQTSAKTGQNIQLVIVDQLSYLKKLPGTCTKNLKQTELLDSQCNLNVRVFLVNLFCGLLEGNLLLQNVKFLLILDNLKTEVVVSDFQSIFQLNSLKRKQNIYIENSLFLIGYRYFDVTFFFKLYSERSISKMKQVSDIHETSNLKLNSLKSEIEEEFVYSPIQDLQLQVDKQNAKDRNELNMILVGILSYPSDTLAQQHSEAMRLGNFDLEAQAKKAQQSEKYQSAPSMTNPAKLCKCCGFKRHEQSIKLCVSFDDISNMGTSTYLYFETFKNLGMLLGILTLVYSIYALVTNVIAAKNNALGGNYTVDYLTISLASKQSNATDLNKMFYYIQAWLGVAVVIIWIIIFFVNRYREYKKAQEYDDETISISDYSISLEGIPLDVTLQEIQNSFDEYYKSITSTRQLPSVRLRPLKVAKLNIGKPFYFADDALKNDELQKIQQQIEQIKEMLRKWVWERRLSLTFSQPQQKRNETYKRLVDLVKQREIKYKQQNQAVSRKLKQKNSDELTTAFVTFETNIARNFLLHFNEFALIEKIRNICNKNDNYQFKRGDKTYLPDVDKAPQPEDIIWANIGRTDCNVGVRKGFTFTITGLLLGGSFMIVYGLSKAQQSSDNDRVLSIIISLVITVINIVLGQAIRYLTYFEKDYTSTYRQTSLAVKSIVAQMINSILTPVITAYYIQTEAGVYRTGGLVDNIFLMSITNAIVPPILVLFNPAHFLTKLVLCFKSTKQSKLYRTQKEHNQLYEGVEFEVGYSYIYIVNVFLFVCFFVSLQPIVSVMGLLGYLLMYWAQKYSIFQRYKRPVPGTDFVNKTVYQWIFLGPLVYSLGSLTWSNFDPTGIPKEALIPNILAAVISALLVILPINPIILSTCFDQDAAAKETRYQEDRLYFPTEFDRVNPSTSLQGISQYKSYMQRKHAQIKNKSKEQQEQIDRRQRNGWQRGTLNQNQANVLNQFTGIQAIQSPILNNGFHFMNQPAVFNPISLPPINPSLSNQGPPAAFGGMNPLGGMGNNPDANMGSMGNLMNVNPMGPMGFNPYQQQQFSPYGFGSSGFGAYGGGGFGGW